MARKLTYKSMRKETITPPKKALLTKAANNLQDGDPEAARIMAEASVAARQGISKSKR
jgi:hypothetical protein